MWGLIALLATAAVAPASRPAIHPWFIPFGATRRRETAAYSKRHYGTASSRLVHPRVIVEHISVAPTARADFNTFASDRPDIEFHEKPNVCAHFVVNGLGHIYQMVPLTLRCRHTVGLNDTAIGIEHTGYSDRDLLRDHRQLRASLRLTRYLRCRFHIPLRDVIGHAESLSSPYHHERVPALRTQTHGDMRHASMVGYRRKLRGLGLCP